MGNTNEIIDLLKKYTKLEENIKGIKNPEVLRVNDDYRNLIRIESELKKYVLNGEEIIKIYKHIKEKTISECERGLEILLDEIVTDLENLTWDKKGTIIDEISEVINKYKKGYKQS